MTYDDYIETKQKELQTMQLTVLGTNLKTTSNPSIADLTEVENIILGHDHPQIFAQYFSVNPKLLNLEDDVYNSLKPEIQGELDSRILEAASMGDHVNQIMAGENYTEVFHCLNERVNTTKDNCHPIERVIEAVSDSSNHSGFDQKDFLRNIVNQFGGLSEVLRNFSDDEISEALEE